MLPKLETPITEEAFLKRVELLKADAIELWDLQKLAHYYAHYRVLFELMKSENEREKGLQIALIKLLNNESTDHKGTLEMLEKAFDENIKLEAYIPFAFFEGAKKNNERVATKKKVAATKAINARHDQPNGYRNKKKKMLDEWATGKYKTHIECAQNNYHKIGVSEGTALKYLTNIPKPNKPT